MVDLHRPLAEYGVGEGVALADRDRREVGAMGDVADGVDLRHRSLRPAVDGIAAIPGIDGDAAFRVRDWRRRDAVRSRTSPDRRRRSTVRQMRGVVLAVLVDRFDGAAGEDVMPCFSISLRTWARTSSSKPRRMLSPRWSSVGRSRNRRRCRRTPARCSRRRWIRTRFGNSAGRNASFEEIACSIPGMAGP